MHIISIIISINIIIIIIISSIMTILFLLVILHNGTNDNQSNILLVWSIL